LVLLLIGWEKGVNPAKRRERIQGFKCLFSNDFITAFSILSTYPISLFSSDSFSSHWNPGTLESLNPHGIIVNLLSEHAPLVNPRFLPSFKIVTFFWQNYHMLNKFVDK
jgi:hypothetical protein